MTRPGIPPAEPARRDLADIEARVRAAGGRITAGRRAVIDAFLAADGWLTADAIVAQVRDQWPAVNEASVYRSLEVLEQAGVISHTHLGHSASHWRLATDSRQSLVCERCGRVVHIPAGWLADLHERLRDDLDFVVAPDHFAWSGFCTACVEAAG